MLQKRLDVVRVYIKGFCACYVPLEPEDVPLGAGSGLDVRP